MRGGGRTRTFCDDGLETRLWRPRVFVKQWKMTPLPSSRSAPRIGEAPNSPEAKARKFHRSVEEKEREEETRARTERTSRTGADGHQSRASNPGGHAIAKIGPKTLAFEFVLAKRKPAENRPAHEAPTRAARALEPTSRCAPPHRNSPGRSKHREHSGGGTSSP